ncbi:MAG: cyclase family protein, partial [Thermodesulfobacteriota bacterium]
MKKVIAVFGVIAAVTLMQLTLTASPALSEDSNLWNIYDNVLKKAKYVDLTHAFSPTIAVWPGFGNAEFKPAVAGKQYKGYCEIDEPFEYEKHGFIA